MTPPKQRRLRASKPKVRTGCKTCKKRHVKCDEARPECGTCIKSGRECDGYHDTPPGAMVKSRAARPIASNALMSSPSNLTCINNQEEHHYMRYFCEHTAPALSGGFVATIWDRSVLQTSTAEPAIHQLVLSIAALSRAQSLPAEERNSIVQHRDYANHEYSRALRGIQGLAQAGDRRSLLIASMLVYCYENLQGNGAGAMAYLKSIRSLILVGDEPLIYRHLTPLPIRPKDIEADLVTAFARLDGNLSNRLENDDPELRSVLGVNMDYEEEPYELPPRFVDTETARRYLEHIWTRSRPAVDTPTRFHPDATAETISQLKMDRKRKVTILESQVKDWMYAFEPLFLFGRTPAGREDYVATMTLKIQVLALSCILMAQYMITGVVPEIGVPTTAHSRILEFCRSIAEYGWELVKDERFTRGFVFDHGIIPSVMILALTSPDPSLAKEGVAILRAAAPRKESTWDAANIANICERSMKMQAMKQYPTPPEHVSPLRQMADEE